MLEYYELRRPEYESIYAKPERQDDLAWLGAELSSLVAGRNVLEIACGTGYWSRRIARWASVLRVTDASRELALAALSSCDQGRVSVDVIDAFHVPVSPGFDCLVAGFFFSHVLREQRAEFVAGLAAALDPGARLVMFDNTFVAGSSTAISRKTEAGDTYQLRILADGSSHDVVKNFPSVDDLRSVLTPHCREVEIKASRYFWLASGVFDDPLRCR